MVVAVIFRYEQDGGERRDKEITKATCRCMMMGLGVGRFSEGMRATFKEEVTWPRSG